MQTEELRTTLKRAYDKAEAVKREVLASDDALGIDSNGWAKVVRLMNLQTACKDVMRYWKACRLGDEQ